MEWERAKSYILIFFLLLNLGLAGLWLMEYNRYMMTAEQERIIHAILGRNNISMYTRPMRRTPPMRPLNVSAFYYDVDSLLEMFFSEPCQLINHEGEQRFDCEDTDSTLIISNGFIAFESRSENGFRDTGLAFPRYLLFPQGNEITRAAATMLTDKFIDTYFPNFQQDSIFYAHGEPHGVRVIYRELYRGRIIHSNFIEFLVTAHGIRQIEMQFGRVIGHGGTTQMIFAPDEVLLTFVQLVRLRAQNEPLVITHMDLVYFQEYFRSDQPDVIYNAEPFYRIFIQGEDRPFLINAYRNVSID